MEVQSQSSNFLTDEAMFKYLCTPFFNFCCVRSFRVSLNVPRDFRLTGFGGVSRFVDSPASPFVDFLVSSMARMRRDFRSGFAGFVFALLSASATRPRRDLPEQQALYLMIFSKAISASVDLPLASNHLGDSGIILKKIHQAYTLIKTFLANYAL